MRRLLMSADSGGSLLMLGMDSPVTRPGGLNRYFDELFNALANEGTDLHVIRVGSRPVITDVLTEVGSGSWLLGRVARYLQTAARRAKDATVVDVHFALYAALPLALGMFKGKRLIVHFHGPWYQESVRAGTASWRRAQVKRLVERYVYGRADEVVVLSQAFGELLHRDFAVPNERIRLIRPGVAEWFFHVESRAHGRSPFTWGDSRFVVCVRRLTPRMGIDVLLRAWAVLQADGVKLVVVGDGPARGDLQALADRLGIGSGVVFTGRVDDSTLADIYSSASLAVVPSVALEGFGLVVLEALAAGTPVVGTDVGGLPEVLRPLRDDLVVPPDDEHALAERLAGGLRGDVPSAEECKRYARGFRWSAVAAHHAEVYWP
jgi:glycosyltransferase involved in cell wall biosynthesis